MESLQLPGNSKGVWRLSFVLLVSVERGDAREGKGKGVMRGREGELISKKEQIPCLL